MAQPLQGRFVLWCCARQCCGRFGLGVNRRGVLEASNTISENGGCIGAIGGMGKSRDIKSMWRAMEGVEKCRSFWGGLQC